VELKIPNSKEPSIDDSQKQEIGASILKMGRQNPADEAGG